jgi:hypothetical protein
LAYQAEEQNPNPGMGGMMQGMMGEQKHAPVYARNDGYDDENDGAVQCDDDE